MSAEKNLSLSVILTHLLTQMIDVLMPGNDLNLLPKNQQEPMGRLPSQAKKVSNLLSAGLGDKKNIDVTGIICDATTDGLNAAARIINDALKSGEFSEGFLARHLKDNAEFSAAMDLIGNLLKLSGQGGPCPDPN